MSNKTVTTEFNWQAFFSQAEKWIFQAAPATEENKGKPSLGGMETIYQAFKARMEAEREQQN